jgi:hypothetical protein
VKRADSVDRVQRLFSMFPQGGPGLALILLRLTVAGTFLIEFWTRFGAVVPTYILFGVVVVALSLGIGIFTPIICVLICAAESYYVVLAGTAVAIVKLSAILNAAALALLGPGAYSIDAWLYGRRVVVVPPRKVPENR